MRDIDRDTVTQAVIESFRTEPGSRFEMLLQGLIRHLHDFCREVEPTHEEWMAALSFLYDCGQVSSPERQEFILLSDVLGVSALVDMINTRPGATEGSNLGPFYLDDAPARALGDHLAEGREGRVVLVHGRVTDTAGNPLPGAVVDTWQADGDGRYPVTEQPQGEERYDLRGKFTCDEQGAYRYTTILPRPYTLPDDGPVGRLLRAGERHNWRAAHLHYIVRAPGMQAITTELFFENAEHVEDDAVFGVRNSLVARVEPLDEGDAGRFDLRRRPEAKFRFDFALAPEG